MPDGHHFHDGLVNSSASRFRKVSKDLLMVSKTFTKGKRNNSSVDTREPWHLLHFCMYEVVTLLPRQPRTFAGAYLSWTAVPKRG
jgi:hypothetical protein